MAEELRAANLGLLLTFYGDNVAFDALARGSAQLLNLLMKRGTDRVYFPEPIYLGHPRARRGSEKRIRKGGACLELY